MSAKAGPVAAVKPTSMASGSSGKPSSMPTTRKISAVANAGNQPACIAERPTTSSETRAARAAKTTKPAVATGDISATIPAMRASAAAATTYAAKPPPRARPNAPPPTVWGSEPARARTAHAICPSATSPAPIMIPWGTNIASRSRPKTAGAFARSRRPTANIESAHTLPIQQTPKTSMGMPRSCPVPPATPPATSVRARVPPSSPAISTSAVATPDGHSPPAGKVRESKTR